jgi:hypothetical protein
MPRTDHKVIHEFRNVIREQNWDAARLALHPYLHWTQPDGTVIRGRKNVLATLTDAPKAPAPPQQAELRDGQIYRWLCRTECRRPTTRRADAAPRAGPRAS